MPIIIVDTKEDADKEKYMEKIKLYDTGVLVLNNRAIVVSKVLTGEESIYYSNIITEDIQNKIEFINLLSGSNIMYVYLLFGLTIFIYMFIVYLASNLVDAIILGAIGYIFARIVKVRLKYKATFIMGIYALTLPIILNLIYIIVNTFTGFTISYFQWMYTTISYIYIAVAILMIKTEIITQQLQLAKITQIQEEIHEEEVTEEKEKEEDKGKEEQKEEKEEKKENKQSGEQPEGSNA